MIIAKANRVISKQIVDIYLDLQKSDKSHKYSHAQKNNNLTVEGIDMRLRGISEVEKLVVEDLKEFLVERGEARYIRILGRKIFIAETLMRQKLETDKTINYSYRQLVPKIANLMIEFLLLQRKIEPRNIASVLNIEVYKVNAIKDSRIDARQTKGTIGSVLRDKTKKVVENTPITQEKYDEMDKMIAARKSDTAIAIKLDVSLRSVSARKSEINQKETIDLLRKKRDSEKRIEENKAQNTEIGPGDIFGIPMFQGKKEETKSEN